MHTLGLLIIFARRWRIIVPSSRMARSNELFYAKVTEHHLAQRKCHVNVSFTTCWTLIGTGDPAVSKVDTMELQVLGAGG